MSNDPWNFPNFHMTVVLVHVKHRKNLKAVRGSYLPFIVKHALFPLGTTSLLVSCSGLWGVCVQTSIKQANFFYHIVLVAWHYIKKGFMFFWSFLIFLELKCHGMHSMCVPMPWDQYVWKFLLIYCIWN